MLLWHCLLTSMSSFESRSYQQQPLSPALYFLFLSKDGTRTENCTKGPYLHQPIQEKHKKQGRHVAQCCLFFLNITIILMVMIKIHRRLFPKKVDETYKNECSFYNKSKKYKLFNIQVLHCQEYLLQSKQLHKMIIFIEIWTLHNEIQATLHHMVSKVWYPLKPKNSIWYCLVRVSLYFVLGGHFVTLYT